MDWHRIDDDPDPNLHVRIGIKSMPIVMRILTQVLHMLENQNTFILFLVTALPVCNVLSLSVSFEP